MIDNVKGQGKDTLGYSDGSIPIPLVVDLAIEALEARWRKQSRKSG